MERAIKIQLKLLTNKPDKMTLDQIEKTLVNLFKKDSVLKRFSLIDVSKLKWSIRFSLAGDQYSFIFKLHRVYYNKFWSKSQVFFALYFAIIIGFFSIFLFESIPHKTRYFPLIGFCGITFVIRFVRALSGVFYTIVSSTSSFFVSV